jgi:signal transduction histidine kinase
MRIRTQLFFGIVLLMLGLIGVQCWLQMRQLQAIERELTEVATNLSQAFYFKSGTEFKPGDPELKTWQEFQGDPQHLPAPDPSQTKMRIRVPAQGEKFQIPIPPDQMAVPGQLIEPGIPPTKDKADPKTAQKSNQKIVITRVTTDLTEDGKQAKSEYTVVHPEGTPGHHVSLPRIQARIIEAEATPDRLIVISGAPGGEKRIPLPTSRSTQVIQTTLQQGLIAGVLLLLAGFFASAMIAHRLTSPLRQLMAGVEALERGQLGTQIQVTSKGELGELQTTFNRMSARLAELEEEKQTWKAREHLAELGDLARGLAHTLRNPLNTLGLAVEELASTTADGSQDLVTTARGQIRRIDHWLRSFLALGAGGAAEPDIVDIRDLVQDVAFEAIQLGNDIELASCSEPMKALVVPPALRSALANLINNAVEAAPEHSPVTVSVTRIEHTGLIRIADRGPGLPDEVKRRLFTPHITTKTGGSGMGIFLAKQLIEGGHGGKLEFQDNPDGGTIAVISIPLNIK